MSYEIRYFLQGMGFAVGIFLMMAIYEGLRGWLRHRSRRRKD